MNTSMICQFFALVYYHTISAVINESIEWIFCFENLSIFFTEISSHDKEPFLWCFSFHVNLRSIASIEKSFSPNQPSNTPY
jgi:hypothetical protein